MNLGMLNELAKNFDDINVRRKMIKEYENSKTKFSGKNANEENVMISVSKHGMVLETFQDNGWIRLNYYDAEGYGDGETFEGRWK